MLQRHEPLPALVLNGWWGLIDTNSPARRMVARLTSSKAPPREVKKAPSSSEKTSPPNSLNLIEALFLPRPLLQHMVTLGEAMTKRYVVYILYSLESARLYIGITTDLARRLAEHNGSPNGRSARTTQSGRPWICVFQEDHPSRGDASRREAVIKKLTRKQKLRLIQGSGPTSPPRSASSAKPS